MWRQLFNEYKGASIGLVVGIILGLIYLLVGFWKMLVFSFIAFCCVWVGYRLDRREEFGLNVAPLAKWLSERWKMFR